MKLEEFYAVYHDEAWFIGKVESGENDIIKFKCFKLESDHFVWPKPPDSVKVNAKFIIYGPLNIGKEDVKGQLRQHDRMNINKKYKEFKSDIIRK